MWLAYLRLYWNITPNSLSSLHCGMLCILHSSSTNLFYGWWVLCTFQDYLTCSYFQTNLKKLPFTSGDWSTPSFHKGIAISSAYLKSMSTPCDWILRPFRKTLNKYGPLTDPWVEPLLTSFHSPTKLLSYTTLCCLSERKLRYNSEYKDWEQDFKAYQRIRHCIQLSNFYQF